jgi:hypothetical protein
MLKRQKTKIQNKSKKIQNKIKKIYFINIIYNNLIINKNIILINLN